MGKIGAGLAAALRSCIAVLPLLLWNLIGIIGVAGIAYGAWLIYVPAGFIVAGILLLAGAAILAPRHA